MTVLVVHPEPYAGEYHYEDELLPSGLEWEWIHRISGVLPMTFEDAFRGGMPNLFIALAIVAMEREGKITEAQVYQVADVLKRIPFTEGTVITLKGEVEEEAVPLDSETSPDAEPPSSGEASSESSDASPANVSRLPSGGQSTEASDSAHAISGT